MNAKTVERCPICGAPQTPKIILSYHDEVMQKFNHKLETSRVIIRFMRRNHNEATQHIISNHNRAG